MNKKKKYVIAIVLALVTAALIFGVALAFNTQKKQCKRPWFRPSPQACMVVQYEVQGDWVRLRSYWQTKEYEPGWVITTVAPIEGTPLGWTRGEIASSVGWAWYYNGNLKSVWVCTIIVDAVSDGKGGHLVVVKGCH